ncbi:MAG: ACP S-malonyltransferase [Propionibacteriaceae bacterium]
MFALVTPGQGSQTSGFLSSWIEIPSIYKQLEQWSEIIHIDLIKHGTISDADTIQDTAIAQPLLVAAGIVTAKAVLGDDTPDVLAGHSVGEITAAALAGIIDAVDAVQLAKVRGEAMAAAAANSPTTMTAVLGGNYDDVLSAIAEAGLSAANINGVGQIVAAGSIDHINAFEASPPPSTRTHRLSVAGAFHTDAMASAIEPLQAAIALLPYQNPRCPLLSNSDGAVISEGKTFLSRLITQVANPVRWDLCQESLSQLGVTGVLEVAPASTLVGLAKRGIPEAQRFALNRPDQLDDARAFLAEHL